jgi:hypothetical protein
MESASYVVEGWGSVLTKDEFVTQLDARLDQFATKEDLEKLRTELHKELRNQTGQLAKLVAGAQGIVVVAIAAIGAVLRFA